MVYVCFNRSVCENGILCLKLSRCSDFQWKQDCRPIVFWYSITRRSEDYIFIVVSKELTWVFEQLNSNFIEGYISLLLDMNCFRSLSVTFHITNIYLTIFSLIKGKVCVSSNVLIKMTAKVGANFFPLHIFLFAKIFFNWK